MGIDPAAFRPFGFLPRRKLELAFGVAYVDLGIEKRPRRSLRLRGGQKVTLTVDSEKLKTLPLA